MQYTTSTNHQSYNSATGLRTTSDRGFYAHPCELENTFDGCNAVATLMLHATSAGQKVRSTDFASCAAHQEAVRMQVIEAAREQMVSYQLEVVVEPFAQNCTERWMNIHQEQVR